VGERGKHGAGAHSARLMCVVIDRSLLAVPQPAGPDERVIRYSRHNGERCACRLLALAAVKAEIRRAELAG
jgi:hypothetical protein